MPKAHRVSHTAVGELLTQQKFSLQANSKTKEGGDHPDRDAQFRYINQSVTEALGAKQPLISVDIKKKESVGDFKNAGREWRPQGMPEALRVHDFLIKELGRAVPYGVYDWAAYAGWVCVGMDNDTAAFAVQTIRRWWYETGRKRYPDAKHLVITADGGGSNGSRVRLWKRELQRLANEIGIEIKVNHLPPLAPASGTRSVSRTHAQRKERCKELYEEMRVGPSTPAVRCRRQTTQAGRCALRAVVVSVAAKGGT